MLDLILKLIDRLIALAKKREEVNRGMFVDFVQPAFQTFETVHADYIDSMTRYMARLEDRAFKMTTDHPVFRDIEMDSLKSEHLRTKLADFKPIDAPAKLRPFLIAINFYLRGLSASGARAEFPDKVAVPSLQNLNINEIEEALGGKDGFGGQAPGDAYLVLDAERPRYESVIFADPMRQALREQLLGFDSPSEPDAQWKIMCTALGMGIPDPGESWPPTDEQRRRLCAFAVSSAMRHFQFSYRHVSTTYSALRSGLISPA
jgi:hypothetical protein